MNKQYIGEKASPNKFKCSLKIKSIRIFTFCVLFFSAMNSYSQQFTFKQKSITLKDICNKIEKESDFIFVFSDHSETKIGKKIDIDVHAKNVTDVLDIIFSGTGLAYRILDKQIVVYEKKYADGGEAQAEECDYRSGCRCEDRRSAGRCLDPREELRSSARSDGRCGRKI